MPRVPVVPVSERRRSADHARVVATGEERLALAQKVSMQVACSSISADGNVVCFAGGAELPL